MEIFICICLPINNLKFQVLNISNNGVDNLDFIENLKELRILKCEDNKIEKVTTYNFEMHSQNRSITTSLH